MTRTTGLVGLLLSAAAASAQPPPPSPLSYAPPPPPPPLAVQPELDCPDLAQVPGFFASAEIAFLQPALSFGLVSQVPLGSPPRTVRVPDVSLDGTVSPTIEIGYRLPEGGAFAFTYHFLAAEGTGVVEGAQVRSRLDVQVFDLDYALAPIPLLPRLELNARLGGRIANVFFDSRATDGGGMRQASNDFFGAGIHGRVELERRFTVVEGLSAFGRLDGAALIGQSEQRFQVRDVAVTTMSQRGQQTVPTLNAQAGLSYAPAALPGLKFSTGYEYEKYFDVANVGQSSGEAWAHGWFLRGRFDF